MTTRCSKKREVPEGNRGENRCRVQLARLDFGRNCLEGTEKSAKETEEVLA
jgi:hypothetical protein